MSLPELLCAGSTTKFDVADVHNFSGMFAMLRVGERYVALRAPDANQLLLCGDSGNRLPGIGDVVVHASPLMPDDKVLRSALPRTLLVAPDVGAHYAAARIWPLGRTILLVPRRYKLTTRRALDGSDDRRPVLAIDELYALKSPDKPRRRLVFGPSDSDNDSDDDGGDSSGGWIQRITDDF